MNTCVDLGEISAVTLALAHPSFGIFSGLTMTSMTGGWYHRVSPTEALLIGMVILQVFVLRYLQILPLDLNQSFHDGFFAGLRKRRNASGSRDRDTLTASLLTILRRLDYYDCVPRFLCEAKRRNKKLLSRQTLGILEAIKRFGLEERECRTEQAWKNGTFVENERPVIAELEEAMLHEQSCKDQNNLGIHNSSFHKSKNCTCAVRYANCPLSTDEIFQLVSLSE